MKNALYIVAGILIVTVATWAYRINYDTQEANQRVASLKAQIARERSTIAVLEAEWAYLNRPERLRALVDKHFGALQLMPLHPDHFGAPAMVAYPPQKFLSIEDAVAAVMAEGGNQ